MNDQRYPDAACPGPASIDAQACPGDHRYTGGRSAGHDPTLNYWAGSTQNWFQFPDGVKRREMR